jgi:membrane associated rhomboid family serine protease
MVPIRDDNPRLFTPLVTWALIAVNAICWFAVQGFGEEVPLARSICEFGTIPAELLGHAREGARVSLGVGSCVLGEPRWHTVVTSMFMHGGWLHLIGNMWFLYIFGDNVEDSMGRFRFAVFYLVCGAAAAAAQIAIAPASPVPMVGASGAIGGVMGAYVVLYPRVRVHLLVFLGIIITTIAVPAIFMLGYWLLLQLLGGAQSLGQDGGGVAFWAHVGGFAAGAVLVVLFKNPELVARHPYYGWRRPSPRRWR